MGFQTSNQKHYNSDYGVSQYHGDQFECEPNLERFEFEFIEYIKGLFNGLHTTRIKISDTEGGLIYYLKRKFEEDFVFAFNAEKMTKASTYDEDCEYFKIWETEFDKINFQIYFEDGVNLYELSEDWQYIEKMASDRFYLTCDDGRKVNLYYFFIYKNKKSGYNKKVNETKKEKSKGGFMNVGKTMTDVMDVNKNAAKQAAMIKIGDTATQTVVDILKKNAIPKKYQKFADTPFFKLIVANGASVAMKQLVPNKTDKVDAVADAMVLASMIDITNMIDINAIVKQVMETVDLSGLTGTSEKN